MVGKGRGRPKTVVQARCLKHEGSHVVAYGVRQTQRGEVLRFRCTPAIGKPHIFTAMQAAPGRAVAAKWSAPPPCPKHDGSKVVRNGTYGKGTAVPRQGYKCFPADGSKPHKFTPPLPRDHVHENAEHCDHCDELRGVHRGETAVARRHSWSTRVVARALEMLANGASYSDVSRWALRVSGGKRSRRSSKEVARAKAEAVGLTFDEEAWDAANTTPHEPVDEVTGEVRKKRKASQASKESRNAWHIAADWVEAFSAVIFEPVEQMLRDAATSERARLEDLASRGEPLTRPQVILVDDVPVYGRDLDRKKRSRRDAGYFVLVLAELHWPDDVDHDGMTRRDPTIKLRLVRAMSKSNTASWRLMFNELGYTPDYIVADAGTGISGAIKAHFDPACTKFIPSLWHVANKVELGLADTPGALTVTPAGKELIPPLRDHVRKLSRTSGVLDSGANWTQWWDDVLAILKTHHLAADEVRSKRKNYEAPMKAVLADIAAQPDIPVSTGGLETMIAKQVKPLLAMRRTSFANIERTNLLFDLVVARQHGAFDNLSEVGKLLRLDGEAHEGWTVPLRAIADPRPRGGVYSSLRDTTLLNTLAKRKGVA